MKTDSGGAVTTICMLVPLVAVPYFAIRGSGDFPSEYSGVNESVFEDASPFEDVTFESKVDELGEQAQGTDGFGTEDTLPMPGGETEVHPPAGMQPTDPFDDVEPGESLLGHSEQSHEQHQRKQGLNPRQLGPGDYPPQRQEPTPEPPAQKPALTVTEKWDQSIARLKASGMRHYKVETLSDRTEYYVTAWFPQDGIVRMIEGQGKHPLLALQHVVSQVGEMNTVESR